MDPAFPRGGANLLFGILFAENCVKMNKIGLGREIRNWLLWYIYRCIKHIINPLIDSLFFFLWK